MLQLPCVERAARTVTPASGSTSVSTTSTASAGPRFANVSDHDMVVPAMTGLIVLCLIKARSALAAGCTSVLHVALLLLVSGSGVSSDATVTVLTRTLGVARPALTVNAVSISRETPGSIVSNSHGNAVAHAPVFPMNVVPAGSVSRMLTFVAVAGPRLVTTIE